MHCHNIEQLQGAREIALQIHVFEGQSDLRLVMLSQHYFLKVLMLQTIDLMQLEEKVALLLRERLQKQAKNKNKKYHG
jgi:hypothetical protein